MKNLQFIAIVRLGLFLVNMQSTLLVWCPMNSNAEHARGETGNYSAAMIDVD
jgi:hypothetical protein